MLNPKKAIADNIQTLKSMNDFVVVHEEIAANHMRRIRDAVINRRDFLAELTQLYNEVKKNYKKEMEILMSKNKRGNKSQTSLLKKNNKTACVLLSTNSSLYGDIVDRIYTVFSDQLRKEKGEAIIVGKVGKRFFERDNPGMEYTYFDFPDVYIDSNLLKPIILNIIQYEKVIVYHSKFQTLLVQTPTAFLISENQADMTAEQIQAKYIFEPSLEKIVEYFEKEIFGSIFEQTMHESHLSKYASRMVTLDAASENIKKKITDLNIKQRVLRHQIMNKDQINSIARLGLGRRTFKG